MYLLRSMERSMRHAPAAIVSTLSRSTTVNCCPLAETGVISLDAARAVRMARNENPTRVPTNAMMSELNNGTRHVAAPIRTCGGISVANHRPIASQQGGIIMRYI